MIRSMKRWYAVLGLVALGGIGWWGWQGRGVIDPRDPEQVALGKQLYGRHCAECHGADLQGEPEWQIRRPTGELPAPPHDATGHTWHHPDATLFDITKHGVASFAPPDYKTNMPAFAHILSDAEIRAILAYIKSSWPENMLRRQEGMSKG
jgi:mono/diheme cytochrome c family protein